MERSMVILRYYSSIFLVRLGKTIKISVLPTSRPRIEPGTSQIQKEWSI
jgi:hypothetical protein